MEPPGDSKEKAEAYGTHLGQEARVASDGQDVEGGGSRAEELLRYFVKHVPAAVAMFDRDLRYLLVSDRWLEDYRFEDTDVIGSEHLGIFPDFQDRWRGVLERCLEGAIERCEEDTIERLDGTVDYLRWEVRPWRGEDSEIGGVVVFSELITRQKQLETAVQERTEELERTSSDLKAEIARHEQTQEDLRKAEDELLLTFAKAPLGIATMDLSGRFQWANPAFCGMMGYPEDEVLELTFREITHPEDVARSCHHFDKLSAGLVKSYSLRKRYLRKSGETLEGMLYCVCIHDAEQQPKIVVAQVVDYTERIKAEEDSRWQREQIALIDRVNTMGEMAAGIAHEINQPLTAIATYAQACQRLMSAGETSTAEVLDVMGRISEEALRAGSIVHRLRALVRKHESQRMVCNINDLIKEIAELATVDARHRGVPLDLDLAGALPSVAVDRVQIQQVTLNLIRNALDATSPTSCKDCRVQVRTRQVGDEIEVSVVDQGTGLTPGAEEELFRPFYTTKETGMGMGLPISRSIVDSHGGRIWFRRNKDRGVTFSFRLPLSGEHDDKAI